MKFRSLVTNPLQCVVSTNYLLYLGMGIRRDIADDFAYFPCHPMAYFGHPCVSYALAKMRGDDDLTSHITSIKSRVHKVTTVEGHDFLDMWGMEVYRSREWNEGKYKRRINL